MFEPKYLGQVRVKGASLGQSQGQPSPASSDSRFAIPAADQNFNVTPPLTPFMVPFMAEWPSYPQGYSPDRYTCVLNSDGLSWTCTPKISAPVIVAGPPYPVVVGPFGPFGY